MIRAFLGLDLPEDIRSALAVQQFLLPLPRRVDPDQLHLTLVFLGDCPPDRLEAAHEGFAALHATAFPLALQGLGLFGGDRPHSAHACVAPSEPLMRLQARVEQAARAAGLSPEHRKFTPHVTLGRFPPLKGPAAAPLERQVAETPFAAGPWQVRDMVLWQSHLGPKGSRYQELARYPLSP